MWKIVLCKPSYFVKEIKGFQLIKEVVNEPNKQALLEIDGDIYRWAVSHDNYFAVWPLNIAVEDDIAKISETHQKDWTCPFCEYVYNEAFELPSDGTIKCPSCTSKVSYTSEVDHYKVVPVKKGKIKKY